MKKNLVYTFLLSLFCCVGCQSNWDMQPETINPSNIQSEDNLPESFFTVDSCLAVEIGVRSNKFSTSSTRSILGKKTIKNVVSYNKARSNNPIMYIENFQEGGFCIISADKRIKPILAYSDEGEFTLNNAPDGVIDWINTVSEVVTDYRENNLQPDWEVLNMWDSEECPIKPERIAPHCNNPDYAETILKGPYLKSKWGQRTKGKNQNEDYNKYCPADCPTGCSAVAVGQIMRFWEYPKNYVWNEMLYYKPTDTTARFLAELGNSNHLDIDYSTTGSSAKNTIYDNVLRDYGYNASRELYDYKKVENELYAGRPVMLSGTNSNGGGHVWVCDGLQIINNVTSSVLLLHMNWGGGGNHDGYYQFNNWTYVNQDTNETVTYTPNLLHRMFINIYPK